VYSKSPLRILGGGAEPSNTYLHRYPYGAEYQRRRIRTVLQYCETFWSYCYIQSVGCSLWLSVVFCLDLIFRSDFLAQSHGWFAPRLERLLLFGVNSIVLFPSFCLTTDAALHFYTTLFHCKILRYRSSLCFPGLEPIYDVCCVFQPKVK